MCGFPSPFWCTLAVEPLPLRPLMCSCALHVGMLMFKPTWCRYEPFLVAETVMEQASQGAPVSAVGSGRSAFNALAGYIFGKNEREERMKMTTPVFSDSQGRMQFVIGRTYKVSAHAGC